LPLRLVAAGYAEAQAMALFGAAAGQAIPILFIPSTLITSFTLVLIPEISENFYRKRYYALKEDVEKALKFTALLSCAFIPLFCVCGEEIGVLIFGSYDCGKYLAASAFLVPFIGLSGITTSILNSIGCEIRALIYCVISGVFMLLSIWFLPKVSGIYALLIGFSFVYVLTTILNVNLIRKKCPQKPKLLMFFFCAAMFSLPALAVGIILENLLLKTVGTFFCFVITAIAVCAVYALCCLGSGLVGVDFIKTKILGLKRKKVREYV